ncbi:Lipopolysaccharide heptosyltransferase 1 [Poriferisphaera corsica]|uniref:Lipopolysaccharide heptosyltransferase 1 n=1 Tax=Poriferisphaera corsica TaxID=2528020 RepID=A0A517YYC7_9BACT|nr:glycosyltransferase family 9 protein [Poriferisphaera corsica]QDU35231.1 Lipopolysaccharide heptosyltransferase 1 [Poriferisphaera corsica]
MYAPLPTHPDSVRNILIVRPSALGDVARTVGIPTSLKAFYPNAKIHWVVNSLFTDVVRAHPAVDRVIPFNRKRLNKIGRSLPATRAAFDFKRDLQSVRYDLAFDLQGLARSGFITYLSKAPIRIGFRNARELAHLAYNHKHVITETHTIDQMHALLEAENIPSTKDLTLYTHADDTDWLNDFLVDNNLTNNNYTCLAPTARWLCKCWPIEKYAEIGKRLIEQSLTDKLVILAAPNEKDQLTTLFNRFNHWHLSDRIIISTTTVGQMASLISRCKLLVCNDSAALHIGVGFDRAIATIFGPTDPAFVGPYNRSETVIQPDAAKDSNFKFDYRAHKNDQSLIAQVPTDAVWQIIQHQIQRNNNS